MTRLIYTQPHRVGHEYWVCKALQCPTGIMNIYQRRNIALFQERKRALLKSLIVPRTLLTFNSEKELTLPCTRGFNHFSIIDSQCFHLTS